MSLFKDWPTRPRAYVFGRAIKVIFDRADDVYVDVERKFAEALVRD
jgi:hypothetical protein